MEKDTEIIQEVKSIRLARMPIAGFVLSICALILLIVSKSPGTGGPMVILLFLLLVFIMMLCASSVVLQLVSRWLGGNSFSKIRLLYTSVAIAAGVVFLIGLQTLRQLQVVDVVLILVFELLLNFYLLRRF